ncbi:MAG: ATP-dependent transcriptional regulator, partial [Rhodobacteraceae bacterium]|nr:ATP-dependent transcriptional regulator [Paracoccaceae bacterium]
SRAAAIYHADPGLALQGAHADMELAALALTQGQPAAVETLVAGALPRAAAAENAALLATLLMLRAEALQIEGQESAAAAARLDSLGWARYGFGSDADVIGWMRGMAALNPVRGQTPDRFASLQ